MFYTEKYNTIFVKGTCGIIYVGLMLILTAFCAGWYELLPTLWGLTILVASMWAAISALVFTYLGNRKREEDRRTARRKRYYGEL